jgi:hypothetical protein
MVSLPWSRLRFALARRGDDTTPRRFRVKYQRLCTLVAPNSRRCVASSYRRLVVIAAEGRTRRRRRDK